jgi:coenzyme F420-reducing hydrogenase alpha subunit
VTTRTIDVKYLARVEGEGALSVKIRDERVESVELRIFEPPRFFEALLRGRGFAEAPDITSRICGICPIAYQMSAVQAVERALGVTLPEPLRELRRLLYCGEWISSHALHVHMLHAPDFLGYPDAVAMAKDHRQAVERGLALKKTGNQIMALLSGREIHGINVRVGGFYRAPPRAEVRALAEPLRRAREQAVAATAWAAGLEFPDVEVPHELVALRHPHEYPMLDGRIVSSEGLDVAVDAFDDCFVERQVPHSTALHASIKGRGAYLTGPLARYRHNADRLSPVAAEAARASGVAPDERNPFKSIVVRCIEVVHACDEALRLVEAYEPPAQASVLVAPPKAAVWGRACTEAPRGILYHRYRIDPDGTIGEAHIVPPTSQNQPAIEEDLRRVVVANVQRDDDALRQVCEAAIRNHDPCISCATHFLKLTVERTGGAP